MKPTVVFQSDGGPGSGGVYAGVVKTVDPEVGVYDFDHDIQPLNIRHAAYQLSTVAPFWPSGTIFVSVVDPGVGTSRRIAAAKLRNGNIIITPDNGVLTLLAEDIAEVREVDPVKNRRPGSENVWIFHGRDIFSYTAGRLASGQISYEDVGPSYPVEEVVILPLTNIRPVVREGYAEGGIYNMEVAYGDSRINISNKEFQEIGGFRYGDLVHVTIKDGERLIYEDDVMYERAFNYVERRKPLICGDIQPGDKQKIRFTINDINFIEVYAPELMDDMSKAVNFKFTVTRI